MKASREILKARPDPFVGMRLWHIATGTWHTVEGWSVKNGSTYLDLSGDSIQFGSTDIGRFGDEYLLPGEPNCSLDTPRDWQAGDILYRCLSNHSWQLKMIHRFDVFLGKRVVWFTDGFRTNRDNLDRYLYVPNGSNVKGIGELVKSFEGHAENAKTKISRPNAFWKI